jgi:peptidoglycan/xylan/chitin deacetylase (PgdA/CDA1 family)
MYHYVRDLPRTRYPRIRGILTDEFLWQVRQLSAEFEMPTLEAALAFLRGEYTPRRNLCMLTFDDGLKEHATEVMPILAEHQIQGLFGIVTSCIHDRRVAPVHMNHFLTATLDFTEYRDAFAREVNERAPGMMERIAIDANAAQSSYPLDTREMASFKMLVNFLLPANVRDAAIRALFSTYFGGEAGFARELYMSWQDIRQLQSAGMLVAGHTHWHRPLSTLSETELDADIAMSRRLMDQHLSAQDLWPFSYPYGKRNSYSPAVVRRLTQERYDCAFGTEPGPNAARAPLFELCRVDCKNAVGELCGMEKP